MKAANIFTRQNFRNVLLIALFLGFTNCFARKVPGYIVDSNSDTIIGQVKINTYNQCANGFMVFGLNLESFFSSVKFKSDGEKGFHIYYPKDIQKYGFFYDSTEYIFEKFKLESKSIIKSERINYRFLNLVYKGNLLLYRNITRTINPLYDDRLEDNNVSYYDYYLYSAEKGLSKVEVSDEYPTLVDLLLHYGMDQEFLGAISSDLRIGDIKKVLIAYDYWESSLKSQ
jgi:hypothetical protein